MCTSSDDTERVQISGSGSGQAGTSSDAWVEAENSYELPRSVRGAPEHMRSVIRRRQNMEVRYQKLTII